MLNRASFFFLAAAAFLLLPLPVHAGVTGKCYTCHTMHSSQGGEAKNYLGVALGASAPYGYLLNHDCAGCHTGTDNSSAGVGAVAGFEVGTPFVDDSTGNILAGGYFSGTMGKQHDTSDLGHDDTTLGDTPPGGAALGAQLACSGTTGCHAVGGHHENVTGNDATLDGTTPARSFRFLSGYDGVEDSDWQYTTATSVANATDHNYYLAANNNFAAATPTGTISAFCAICHGYFHARTTGANGIKGTNTWTRHPTDVALPTTGEYAGYDPDSGTGYNVEVPVGWTTTTPGVVAGQAVICLSCHYAHGGPNHDLLRWSYAGWPGNGETDGCFTCHSYKQ